MKQKSRRIFFLVITKGLSFLLIAFIFIGAFSSFAFISGSSLLQKRFQGNKSDFQGVIELWCVSEFESGTRSMVSYLESAAIEFEKQNKGAYILISKYTTDECIIQLESKKVPDIFCFSGNVGGIIQEYLIELEESSNINHTILNSSRLEGGELLAYPYALGGYALITSKSRLDSASMFDYNAVFSNALSLGYEKKHAKSVKNIYSICYGTKNKNNAMLALTTEAKIRGVEFTQNKLSVHQNVSYLTGYNAYTKWVNNESVILLGTQRDLARIMSRENSGRETDFVVDYISYYSDILTYVGVTSVNVDKVNISRNFAKFLISEKIQNKLKNIGLFRTINSEDYLYDDKYFLQLEKSLKYLDTVPNIFI